MGNDQQSNPSDPFDAREWDLIEKTGNSTLWQNKQDRAFQVEQHQIDFVSESDLQHEI